jgi:uncharacterized UBP type Zn finger protein
VDRCWDLYGKYERDALALIQQANVQHQQMLDLSRRMSAFETAKLTPQQRKMLVEQQSILAKMMRNGFFDSTTRRTLEFFQTDSIFLSKK